MASSTLLRGARELCFGAKFVARNSACQFKVLCQTRGVMTVHRKTWNLSQNGLAPPVKLGSSLYSAMAESSTLGFRRPEEIQWKNDIANSVTLIGCISNGVDIKYLDSGKIMAYCYLNVKSPSSAQKKEDSRFYVQFWDELAEIAAAHLKKDDHVFISGSIWVETFMGNDNLQKTMCKVVARDLKLVGTELIGKSNVQDREQLEKGLSLEERWKDYFNNPKDYWDNREDKKNPKSPDFKHKVSGDALWIDSKSTPTWVKQRLHNNAELETRPVQGGRSSASTETEKLWQTFFADPSEWWDNRTSKKNPKGPDFKHKVTGEALWIDGYNSPSWVKSQIEAVDEKAKSVREKGGKVNWSSSSNEKIPKTSFEEEDFIFF